MRISIDTGGTFTDFVVLHEDGRIEAFKLPSNPADPSTVILAGLMKAGAHSRDEVVHGSTVATNALLERKGARTALVTTAGFEDVIEIGRQNRAELYVLNPAPRIQLVPRELRFGAGERTYFDGTVARRPALADLNKLKQSIRKARVESIAVCLLHSYANTENEVTVIEALRDLGIYLSRSSELCPEHREYERTSTTVLNSYVGPIMDRYLEKLQSAFKGRLWIMQSNGGLLRPGEAGQQAVRTLLSGPAGGAIGAAAVAKLSGYDRILGFDMGGTSTDVSLSEGSPRETMEAYVEGFPVRVPMLDIETVGAGGGSIARVDAGGLLRVGPESAGADPGPACYGKGTRPTVTDAHVVLGRILPEAFLGGAMKLDAHRSRVAMDTIAKQLGVSRKAAALGVVRVANANMERAIRAVSVERGFDPGEFALVAFGGCGGLHACEMAESLGITTVLVPEHAGMLSALGMLMADRTRDYAATLIPGVDPPKQFRSLEKQARKDLPKARLVRFADMRYTGQSYELTVPWGSSFHEAHHRTYGYSDDSRGIETITLRVRAIEAVERPRLATAKLKGASQQGPGLIADYGATTYIPSGWSFRRDQAGTLIVERGKRAGAKPARR